MHPKELQPSPIKKESAKPTELLGAANVGLQARFLLGDLSNPQVKIKKKQFDSIQENGALGINDRAGNIYQKASLTQRSRYQQEKGLTYAQWRDGFNTYLDGIRNDTEHNERKAFLDTLGITDTVTADDFYEEYLNKKSDIIKFVGEVETQASHEQILNNQDIIRQLGNAFGYESSEVIEHLIHGVKNVKTDSDAFIRKAREKINTIEVITHPLLHKIQKDSSEEVQKQEPGEGEEGAAQKRAEPSAESPPEAQPPPVVKQTTGPTEMAGRKAEPQNIPPTKTTTTPEEKKQEKKEPTQVYPAPTEKELQAYHLITRGEIDAAVKLLYNDVFRRNRDRQANLLISSEVVNNYARELHAMMKEYGREFVLGKAAHAIQTLENVMRDLGLKRDKRSRSQSWYLWGIAKSRFLANNPNIQHTLPNAEKYEPFDPLRHYRTGTHAVDGQKSRKAEEAVINGMVGWEVYRQRKKIRNIILYLQTRLTYDDLRKLRTLLIQSPKRGTETLSSYQLQEIGRLVRSNKQRK